MKTLFFVNGYPVVQLDDGCVFFLGEFTIDADGSPHAYHPHGAPPALDRTANAGHPGNWWGLATLRGGSPVIQGPNDPAPGFYVSTTAYKNPGFRNGDPRRELDSERVPFIVVPHQLIKAVAPIVLGCKAMVIDSNTGKSVSAVVGDVGPGNHLGEGSMAAARALGLSDNPITGGSSAKHFKFLCWPGVPAAGFRLQASGGRAAAVAMAEQGDITYI